MEGGGDGGLRRLVGVIEAMGDQRSMKWGDSVEIIDSGGRRRATRCFKKIPRSAWRASLHAIIHDQQVCNEERLRERARSIPVDSPKKIKRSPSSPVLQTSDDERSILSDSSSHHRHEEPEGDGWQDHQDLQDPDDVSITSSPPLPLHQAPNPVEKRSLRDDES